MRKNRKLLFLSTLLLTVSSCDFIFPWESSTTSDNSVSESETVKPTDSIKESESETMKSQVLKYDSILLACHEKYNLDRALNEQYINEFIDYGFGDSSILTCDEFNNIVALKEGKTTLNVYVNDELLQEIEVTVESQSSVNSKLEYLDAPRVDGHNVVVFGDSITDNSVTAYVDNKPKFWVEMMQETFNLKSFANYAKSGSCVGTNHELVDMGVNNINATHMVNTQAAINNLKKADLVLIYIGTNDYIRYTNKGEKGDVNDSNYAGKESFMGSYYYLISKIKEYAPNARIVMLSTSYSTWGDPNLMKENNFKNRLEINEAIKSIALDTGSMFINLYDLWRDISSYNPDGIHPNTAGYELIFNKIFKVE